MMRETDATGILAMAIEFPEQVRTNDFWKEHYPELIASRTAIKPFSSADGTEQLSNWESTAQKYRNDPFAGVKERRILKPDESVVDLACNAIQKLLKASEKRLEDIEMIIVCSMFPEHIDEGDSAYIAGQLNYKGICWSLNSMCASSLMALKVAHGLIKAGQHENIIVVSTCTYSRFFDVSTSSSFMSGDGTGAFLVGKLKAGQGVIHTHFSGTSESRGLFYNEIDLGLEAKRGIKFTKGASAQVSHLTQKFLSETVAEFFAGSPYAREEIDFLISFDATAWYSEFVAAEIGFPADRTIDIFPRYANISAVSMIAALYHAAEEHKIKEGDLVLIYNHGITSNVGMMLMRWGDVVLG